MPQVRLLNEESTARKSVVTVGVPFEKGALSTTDTLEVANATSQIEKVQWYPQGALYSDGSVKYARCTFPVELTANQNKICDVRVGSSYTEPTFYVDPGILSSIADTQIEVELAPSLPVKVSSTINRIETNPVPGDSSQNFVITFDNDVLDGFVKYNINTQNNTLEWNENATYRVRVEGLAGVYSQLNGLILEGRMVSETTLNKLKFSGSRFSGQIIWQPGNYNPPGHMAYTESWSFTPLSPATLTISLNDTSLTTSVEGLGIDGDQYYRTRYFKRFTDHPSGRPLKPLWMEVIIDTFSNKPYQRFWVRIGNSYFEHQTGRHSSSVDYPEPTIFFSGDVKLKFKSSKTNSNILPHIGLRDANYQTYNNVRTPDEVSYTILSENPRWKNFNVYSQTVPNLNIIPNASCLVYQGVIYHEAAIRSDYTAEMNSDVKAIALNWENLFPPFFSVPPYPSYINNEQDAIDRVDSWVTYFNNTRRIFNLPFTFGFILGSAGITSQAGNQTLSFGAFPSYYMVRSGWPSFQGPVLWWTRQEWWRQGMGYMLPDGTDVSFQNYKTTSQSLGYVVYQGKIFHGSENYGGLSTRHPFSYRTYPEGPLSGPIPGNSFYTKNDTPIGLDQQYSRWTYISNYASSHYACHWQSMIALITMDYMALKWVEKQADVGVASLWEEGFGFADAQKGNNQPARVVGRTAHYFSFFYEILGSTYLREFLETRYGDSSIGFYSGSGVKEILDDPTNYPDPYDYVALYGPWEGLDRRALWTQSWSSVWMEALVARGYYAAYRVLKDYYGSDGALSTKATNIKNMCKHISHSVTRYGFLFDCRFEEGDYVWVEGTLNTRYGVFPYNGVINSTTVPVSSGVYFDVEPGDTIELASDSGVTGTVVTVKREDQMSYNKNSGGWTKKPDSNGNPQNWGFRYTILIKLTSAANSLPATGGFNIVNQRNSERFFCNRIYNGWMIGYAMHAGWSVKRNSTYYGVQADPAGNLTSSTPALASGTPLGTGNYDDVADLTHYPVNNNTTVNYINETPAFKPLDSGFPKYYSLSSSLQLWTYPACTISRYFAEQGDYTASASGTVLQKANEILSFQKRNIPTRVVGSDWGGWDRDFTVHAYVANYDFADSDSYVRISSSPINIRCNQITPDGLPNNNSTNYEFTMGTPIEITAEQIAPTIITAGSTDFIARPGGVIISLKSDKLRKIIIENPESYEHKPNSTNITVLVDSPEIVIYDPSLYNFQVSLGIHTTMDSLDDSESSLSDDDILLGNSLSSDELSELGFKVSSNDYSGPTEGYYDGFDQINEDNNLVGGASGNMNDYLESAEGLTLSYEELTDVETE